MNRNILIVAIIIVIIAVVGIFAFSHSNDGKINTQITFLSESTMKSGDAVQFQLKDAQGNVLANQKINITFVEDGSNQTQTVQTDAGGNGSLVLSNVDPGEYEVIVSYAGDDKYNVSTASEKITIEAGTSQSSTATSANTTKTTSSASNKNTSGSSSSSNELYYDSQYNFYYDSNGIIRGGQNDGMSAQYIRDAYSSGNMVDEDANLQ